MSDENKATSPAPAVGLSDGRKGNVGLDAATVLMQQMTARNIAELEKVKVAEPEVASPPPAEEKTKEPEATEPPSKSEPETEAQPEGEAEEADNDVLSQLELDAKTKEILDTALKQQKERLHGKFQKRIDKEVARRKDLETSLQQQVRELTAKTPAEAPAAPPPYVNPNNPLSNIHDIQTLNSKFVEAKETMRLAEDLAAQAEDNGWTEVEYQGQKFTLPQLKAAHRNARRIVEDHAPQQAQYLQTRHQQTQRAASEFEWLKDRNSPEFVRYQRLMADPDMARRADGPYIGAVLVEGLKVLEARNAAKAKPETKSAPKPKPPASQVEVGSNSGPTRQPEEEVKKSRLVSEQQELTRKGNLKGQNAARFLLNREKLLQR